LKFHPPKVGENSKSVFADAGLAERKNQKPKTKNLMRGLSVLQTSVGWRLVGVPPRNTLGLGCIVSMYV